MRGRRKFVTVQLICGRLSHSGGASGLTRQEEMCEMQLIGSSIHFEGIESQPRAMVAFEKQHPWLDLRMRSNFESVAATP